MEEIARHDSSLSSGHEPLNTKRRLVTEEIMENAMFR